MKKIVKKNVDEKTSKWFIIIGVLIFLIWLFDTLTKMRFFGEYDYLWFCSISLLLVSLAYIFRSNTFIMSFFPIVLEVQIVWMIDFFLLIFAMNTITSNTNYMFDSGQSLIDFIIGLKHLFIIPLLFIELKYIKKPPMKYSWIFFMFVGLAIIVFSPMIPVDNLNCASYPCWMQTTGHYTVFYSIGFYILSVIICFIFYIPIYFLVKKAHLKNNIKGKNIYMKILNIIIIIFLILCITGIFLGFWKYFQSPHYQCLNEKSDLYCERAIFKNSTNDFFAYHINNKMGSECNITAYSDGKILANKEQKIYENPAKGYIFVPIPSKNTQVLIRAVCEI